jgi:hypothetical protein
MSGSRLIFFAGHGGPTWTVGIASADLEDVDLYPAVVVNGGCNTGVTSRWFSVGPDKRICEVRIEPSRSLALRLIKQGAIAHFTALRGHAWSNCAPAVYPVYGAGQSAGEAMKAVYNIYMRLIRNGTEIDVPLLIPGNPYPSGSEWASPLRISACVLFGDPAYVPFPNADKNHHGLPKDFDPLR